MYYLIAGYFCRIYDSFLVGYIVRLISGCTVRAMENLWRLIASLNGENGRVDGDQRVYNVSYSVFLWPAI